MKYTFKIIILYLLVASIGRSQDPFAITGIYHNYSYGFQVTIPKGLIGHWNSGPYVKDSTGGYVTMSDHGRYIPLRDSDGIDIFAGYATDPDYPLPEILFQELEWKSQGADTMSFVLINLNATYLGRLPAFHYLAKYDKNKQNRVVEGILAFSEKEGISFSIELGTTTSKYDNDSQYFKSIYSSWKRARRN